MAGLTMAVEHSAGDRRRLGRIGALLALLAVLPLTLLGYVTTQAAQDALRDEVDARLRTTVSVSSAVVAEELTGLGDLVEAYAGHRLLVAAIGDGVADGYDRPAIAEHLQDFKEVRAGLSGVFLAGLDGRLIDVVPQTPSIVGRDFSYRDWFRGVVRTGDTYVSEAYKSAVAGEPLVVAVATYVRTDAGRPVAILAAILDLSQIQRFADGLAQAQGVSLTVTDGRGTIVARPGGTGAALVRSQDALAAAALGGRSGVTERGAARAAGPRRVRSDPFTGLERHRRGLPRCRVERSRPDPLRRAARRRPADRRRSARGHPVVAVRAPPDAGGTPGRRRPGRGSGGVTAEVAVPRQRQSRDSDTTQRCHRDERAPARHRTRQ